MVRRPTGYDMHMIEPEPTTDKTAPMFRTGCIPTFTTPDEFISKKIKMMCDDFKIKLTAEDIAWLCTFTTEREINNAVRILINKHWKD